ncbi:MULTISPECIES: efflux RND transporter periplasmic adaptor subunit [unclassified Polaromonas]|jgi:Cu(I)/Ag(I) efflux system membrane fusion protein|uniref:efflux RND transporter periplasmic adaptor subunit n=1 Tax=unclassified Polaromonas TaxID=2638319 RepID=UPI000BD8213A|nr:MULTISPECIES: efflux RND transporter periplasmic adaptor subunit [unclassified Polaromonas]OYY33270.1 MAG: efflux transporter periplasmic adaptor subunit [Polaromonas sp. 35-63-35]OYZ17545.1 MAG: efflux transporter periplasmic adaptor subunit [Polaromonas sp. 16-63-31]OYZ76663.1 MAG: efflux transporter periplasmic adaptor subunit [Polaromonas sp. 24-63-21]OZA47812.1 MAG: efflux transporter periplasmic adaptor subunit [Polaromonas sp. 17-63-33]OZA85849.1 MAG: efflux transporter periplasmic a
MNKKYLITALITAGVLGAAGYGLYALGMKNGSSMAAAAPPGGAPSSPAAASTAGPQSIAEGEDATRRHISAGLKAGDTDPVSGRKILYYQDPMVPGNKFDKPGKSPFMDMMLVPVYADGDSDQGKVTVSPRVQQNLGVRTAAVTEGTLSPQVSAVGSIAFNERDQAIVQARATGYVERLYVRATLDRVSKGQPLVDLYVPDWVAAQEEFLAIKRMKGNDLASLVDGARQRMRQAGMSDEQIGRVEASGKTQARITLTAPIGGVVVELLAREGMTVMPGATMFRINGLSTVWANAEVPESQAALLRPGAKVQARSPAAPGTTFDGKVQSILPEVNPATRTLKARLELANPGSHLVPGMFVSMQFMDMRAEKALLIPTEAVIQTGKRTVVMLAEENGRFRPVDVEAGIESGGQTEIKRGLQAGQRVVVSSQFLIDSEASLKGIEARLNEAPKPVAANTATRHEGEAKIEAIGKDAITLSHGPIPSLKWGAMTMEFKSPPAKDLPRNLAAGDQVSFEFYMDAEGLPQLTRISPSSAPSAATPAATGSKK